MDQTVTLYRPRGLTLPSSCLYARAIKILHHSSYMNQLAYRPKLSMTEFSPFLRNFSSHALHASKPSPCSCIITCQSRAEHPPGSAAALIHVCFPSFYQYFSIHDVVPLSHLLFSWKCPSHQQALSHCLGNFPSISSSQALSSDQNKNPWRWL